VELLQKKKAKKHKTQVNLTSVFFRKSDLTEKTGEINIIENGNERLYKRFYLEAP